MNHDAEKNTAGMGAALQRARVLIVGVGGLGSPVALQLAAAGIGTLVLVDPDTVELSNLNRQILHRTSAVGQPKVTSAKKRLADLYPHTTVEAHRDRLTGENIEGFMRQVDFVVDATDGIETKYLINDAAVSLGRPYSHAGVVGLEGQTMTVIPRETACLRCVFPDAPEPNTVPSCQEAGILGAVAGLIGSLQAAETLKYLLGSGELLTNRVATYNALSDRWHTVRVERRPSCQSCGDQAERGAARAGSR